MTPRLRTFSTRARRRRVETLRRREAHLRERLENWGHGDKARTIAEANALAWAAQLAEAVEAEHLIRGLQEKGYDV